MSRAAQTPTTATPIRSRRWRRQALTVGELMTALSGHDAAMPVIVDGYEDGFDSLTLENILVIDIAIDVNDPDLPWLGDHDNASGEHVLVEGGDEWGGRTTDARTEGTAAAAEGPALLLSRGVK